MKEVGFTSCEKGHYFCKEHSPQLPEDYEDGDDEPDPFPSSKCPTCIKLDKIKGKLKAVKSRDEIMDMAIEVLENDKATPKMRKDIAKLLREIK